MITDHNVVRIKTDKVVQTHGEHTLSAMLATCLSVGRAGGLVRDDSIEAVSSWQCHRIAPMASFTPAPCDSTLLQCYSVVANLRNSSTKQISFTAFITKIYMNRNL